MATSPSNLRVVSSGEDDWKALPPMNQETGTAFGWTDQLFAGWTEDGKVFDYGDLKARDIEHMLGRDYNARRMEAVEALPLMSAEREIVPIKGDKGEHDWLQGFWDADPSDGGCATELDTVIGQMTTAFSYNKAFFEMVFDPNGFEDKIRLRKVAYRPATTCRILRDVKNGDFAGFQQESYMTGPGIDNTVMPIQIPKKRAFVYVHGQRLDPLHGTSDLQIAHWCYKTKQKIMFLWFQFLENVALPRTVVKAPDIELARQIAQQISKMRGSAVLPVGTQGAGNNVTIDTLDVSGKGANQFSEAINWLDMTATHSILAGFLDLTGMAASRGIGSFALSKDASDYFLQFLEAKAREIEKSVRRGLFAPLVYYNFGPKAKVPKLKFEPLNTEDKSAQITMLQAFAAAPPGGPVPTEFIAMLAQQVGTYFGMDGNHVHDLFVTAGKAAAAAAAAQSPVGASPVGQATAQISGAVNAAQQMVAPGSTSGPQVGKKPLPPALQHIDWQSLAA